MGYSPSDTTVGKVLNNNVVYYVPRYQRNYVWDEDNWKQLFEDINEVFLADKEVYHFIGSFIFENHNDTCIVVDGQQRLTTLLILLAVIAKKQKLLEDLRGFETTKSYCILQSDEGEKTRICNNDYDILSLIVNNYCIMDDVCYCIEDFFENLGRKITKKDKRFYSCYDYFNRMIDDELEKQKTVEEQVAYLKSFRKTIVDTRVISIIADKEQEGYIIFEILNSRGKPLEEHELLKNYIFMCCRNNSDNDMPKVLWNSVIENTSVGKGASMKKFLSQYTTHSYEKVADNKVYSTLRKRTPRLMAYDLLKDIEKKSTYYYNICNVPEEAYTPKIRYCLNFFNTFNISIIRPVLFSLFEAFDNGLLSEKYLEDSLIKLKNYFSIYIVVCHKKTNEIEELIYKRAKSLHEDFSREELVILFDELAKKTPSYELFITSLKQINYSNQKELYSNEYNSSKKHCEYIIKELELFFSKSDDFVVPKFTIEHIKPDSEGGKANLIGNMIPLVHSHNKSSKNKPIGEKITIYQQSGFALTNKFIERYNKIGKWDDGNIDETTIYVAKTLFDSIWK